MTARLEPDANDQNATPATSIVKVPLSRLKLDPQNPRLPEKNLGGSQVGILQWFDENEVLVELARSFLDNGYFQNEPLIVLPPNQDGDYVVIEGNRRLAALMILLQMPTAVEAELQFGLEAAPTAEQIQRLEEIPVLITADREEVRKFLGFRHIGGLRAWSPEAKARYIEEEVNRLRADGVRDAFREVARIVGSTAQTVRGQYLALIALRFAADSLEFSVEPVLSQRFGVWMRLLQSPDARIFMGLTLGRTADDVDEAVRAMNIPNLGRVMLDLIPSETGQSVLDDSRRATDYGRILRNDRAREALDQFGDIEIAKQIIDQGQLVGRIRKVERLVDLINEDLDSYDLDSKVLSAARGLDSRTRNLLGAIMVRVQGDKE